VVARAGGHPYAGPLRLYHTVWHSVWCGLGDFDKKHGYVWDDRIANDYALPILREQYHVDVPPPRPGHYFVDAYWDDAMLYPKLPEDLPHYDDVLQEKVLRDMRNDHSGTPASSVIGSGGFSLIPPLSRSQSAHGG